MDCLIKIIKGPNEGEEFHCSGTETVMGRSPRSHVRLPAPSVSFEHALILRLGNDFFVENLSAAGTFVNDERIAGRVRLRAKDRLRLGPDTVVRVETVPAGGADSSRRRLLLLALLVLLLAAAALFLWDPFTPTVHYNWKAAYEQLDTFVQQQVAAGKVPSEVQTHFEHAWRLHVANDDASASTEWLRTRILLAGVEDKTSFAAISDANRHALATLLAPPKNAPPPTPDDLAAALIQFTDHMARTK